MDIKTLLLIGLILHAHTCTAIFNVSAEDKSPDTAASAESGHPLDHEKTKTVTSVSGRSFAVSRVPKTTTDEPIFMDETDAKLNCSKGFVFLSYAIKHDKEKVARLCNITNRNATKINQTGFQDRFSISNDSVAFLKGPVVTRFMPSFYILIILISLPLNALALVSFTCRIHGKKPPAVYMSHLACVDLLFALLLPLKIHYQLNSSDWVFGEATCRVLTAAYYCYMYCSILLMMCMSVDRMVAVVFPMKSLTWRNARKASLVCTLAWLLALGGTVPLLAIKQTYEIEDVGVTCHDALFHDTADQLYMTVFSILSCFFYFVPLIVTLVSYCTVIYVLSGKSGGLVKSSSPSDKRRKAVIMCIITLIEFVVCFAPTNSILFYHCVRLATGGTNGEADVSYSYYLLAVCLGSSSVFLDPLLYYYGSSQCRQKICSFQRQKTSNASVSQSKTFPTVAYSSGVKK